MSKQWSQAPKWMTLLGTSERGGRDYAPRIEGDIPTGLLGALYRNGPGLFERDGYRLRHLLDGDGLVQRLHFNESGIRYQNAFVQTKKFRDETAAGRYLYGTWTTREPGGFLRNIGGGASHSQAGVTVGQGPIAKIWLSHHVPISFHGSWKAEDLPKVTQAAP